MLIPFSESLSSRQSNSMAAKSQTQSTALVPFLYSRRAPTISWMLPMVQASSLGRKTDMCTHEWETPPYQSLNREWRCWKEVWGLLQLRPDTLHRYDPRSSASHPRPLRLTGKTVHGNYFLHGVWLQLGQHQLALRRHI